MLEVDDLYLSEVDEPRKLKSAVVKLTTGATASSVDETGALAVITSQSPIDKSNRDLFPNPPRKIVDERKVAPRELIDVNLFARRATSRSKHSSDHRKSAVDEKKLNHAIAKATERSQKTTVVRRPTKYTSPERRVVRSAPSATVTSQSNSANRQAVAAVNRPIFSRLEPKYRIPRKTKEIGVQTDWTGPCKCFSRLAAKNRNRRKAYVANRDLIKRIKLDTADQSTN